MARNFFHPRPEYPRPDRQRGTIDGHDWINLNGPWQFRFDADSKGLEERWFEPDELEWREQIIVPFCWESLAAWGEGDAAGNTHYYATRVFTNPLEVTRENHRSAKRYEVGWYRRQITVPQTAAWRGKRIILTVGAADFFTDAWCNGKHLGRNEGGYLPFEFDLTDALTPGADGSLEGTLVLRVEDPMDNAEQPVGKQWRWYTTVSGIWQTVFIEPRHEVHIRQFRFTGNMDSGSVHVSAECRNTKDNCTLDVDITAPDGSTQHIMLEMKDGRAERLIKLESVRLWDPNQPNLYRVTLGLRCNAALVDSVRTYFGIRKIDFELAQSGVPAALRLNGVARYLRGALHQSYYPEGVYTAGDVETLKEDIAHAKNFGFNFLRIHIKIDDPLLLYWADKLGMLLMADFPNFGEGGDTPLGRQRFETMMRGAIDRDYNHPSIFAWCLFNETWGFGGQNELLPHIMKPPVTRPPEPPSAPPAVTAERQKLPAQGRKPGMIPPQEWVQDMWELAKSLDATRLVEDMSVCHWDHLEYYLHCDTDINSWHFYIDNYEKAKAHIERIVGSTFVGSTFNYVPGFLHKGQPLINSEYGGVGALDGDRDVSWSFKFLTNELRRHQQISAYIYTELHDVEWEYNGFLNYDRTPKEFGYDPRIINESNTLPVNSPPVLRTQPGETIELEVTSSHYSSAPRRDVMLEWVMGGIDDRGRFHDNLASGLVPIKFPHRAVSHAHTVKLDMPKQNMLCTVLLTARTREGERIAENFVHYFVSGGYPAAREEISRALILRAHPADWKLAEWTGGHGDSDKARAEDACSGFGSGFFEWHVPLDGADLSKARRIRVLCEASAHRYDSPQTDSDILPTTLEMSLNGVPLFHSVLRNHPHDSRGILSYLRGGLGGYGYLSHGFAEADLAARVSSESPGELRLRCAVPSNALAQAGLTIYGAECGRYPVTPMIVLEW